MVINIYIYIYIVINIYIYLYGYKYVLITQIDVHQHSPDQVITSRPWLTLRARIHIAAAQLFLC